MAVMFWTSAAVIGLCVQLPLLVLVCVPFHCQSFSQFAQYSKSNRDDVESCYRLVGADK